MDNLKERITALQNDFDEKLHGEVIKSSCLSKQYTVLVAEDSPSELMRIANLLEKRGYSVERANDGDEALSIINECHIDIVVSDWQMPKLDGLALCKKVKEAGELAPYFIVLTGRTNKCELIAAIDSGADDYVVKPLNAEELLVRIKAGLRVTQLACRLAEKNTKLQLALSREKMLNKEVNDSLTAAARLQVASLPEVHHCVKSITSAHCFRPAKGVAGDCYSLFQLDEDHIAFYQIDVAGQGIRAAMQSYFIARYLSEEVRAFYLSSPSLNMLSPKAVAEQLNDVFFSMNNGEEYFTLAYGVLNHITGEGRMTQAGHPPPFIINEDESLIELNQRDTPVGMFKTRDYSEFEFTLPQKGRLVLYTDGIFSCTSPSGALVNEKMLKQIVHNLHSVPITKLQSYLSTVIDRLIGRKPLKDDLSFFVLERESSCEG